MTASRVFSGNIFETMLNIPSLAEKLLQQNNSRGAPEAFRPRRSPCPEHTCTVLLCRLRSGRLSLYRGIMVPIANLGLQKKLCHG
jgi:hypothetical protein